MIKDIENLRRELALVKSAHPLAKGAPAERALDAVVACLVGLDLRISQLEEREGLNHGE